MDGFKAGPAAGCMLGKEVGRGDSAKASPKRKGTRSHGDSPEEGGTYLVTREMDVGGWQTVAR